MSETLHTPENTFAVFPKWAEILDCDKVQRERILTYFHINKGLSAEAIATQFGLDKRNPVSGMMNRLGIKKLTSSPVVLPSELEEASDLDVLNYLAVAESGTLAATPAKAEKVVKRTSARAKKVVTPKPAPTPEPIPAASAAMEEQVAIFLKEFFRIDGHALTRKDFELTGEEEGIPVMALSQEGTRKLISLLLDFDISLTDIDAVTAFLEPYLEAFEAKYHDVIIDLMPQWLIKKAA